MKTVKRFLVIILISGLFFSCWDTGDEDEGGDDPVPESGNTLTITKVSPDSPNNLMFGENITVEFNYSTEEPEGVLIIAEPWTNESICEKYNSGDSIVYSSGEGNGTATCTVSSIHTSVNLVRLKMMSSDMLTVLSEDTKEVNFIYGKGQSYVTNIELDPAGQDLLEPGDQINVTFDYAIYEPDGQYIAVIPLSGREVTDNSSYPDPVKYEFGYGKGSAVFSVSSGDVTIDQLLFDIRNYPAIEGVQKIIDVHFEYGDGSPYVSSNIDLSPASPAELDLNTWVEVDFTYYNCPVGTSNFVNIYAVPFASGKDVYNIDIDPYPFPEYRGNGTGTTSFSVMQDILVTGIKFFIESNDAVPTILYERIIPVNYLYGDPQSYVKDISLSPSSGRVTFEQEVSLSFDYALQSTPGTVKIILYTNGGPTPNQEIISKEVEQESDYFSVNASFTVHQSIQYDEMKVDQILVYVESGSGSYIRCFHDVNLTFDDKI